MTRLILLIVFCLPAVVVGWVVGILSLVLGVAKSPRLHPTLKPVLIVTFRNWFARFWKYSTTISFVMLINPKHTVTDGYGVEKRILAHETVHVRQIIDLSLLANAQALVALLVDPWLALGLWASASVYQLPNFLGVLLRGDGHIYRDAEHERSAYAQTDLNEGASWLDEHLASDREW